MKCKVTISYSSSLAFRLILIFSILISIIFPFFLDKNKFIYKSRPIESKIKTRVESTGSTSMSRLISILSDKFMSSNEGYVYEKSESGSGSAPIMVKSGGADLGDMSRALYDNEKFEGIEEKCIALDGIAVVVNNENHLHDISKETLNKIFSKEITQWSEVSDDMQGEIVTIGREEGSGTKSGFENSLGLKDVDYDIILSESGDISAKISKQPRAIGYISLASVFESLHDVSIDGVKCNLQNVKEGKYLLTRPFIQIYDRRVENKARDMWFEFLKSHIAQKIVEKEKLVYVYK